MNIATLLLAAAIASIQPTVNTDHTRQIDCIARVIDHEARGESIKGKKAVAYVVLNRANSNKYPKTPCKVVTQRSQFSNFTLTKSIPSNRYQVAYNVALEAVTQYSRSSDPTNGALYFCYKTVRSFSNYRLTATIGNHRFYT